MFRAPRAHHQERQIVSIQPLVTVTLCWWPCRVEVGSELSSHDGAHTPLGRFGQRPELSQATGMSLVRYILGKFLGVACHCFPPLLDVPTFASRCLYVRQDARDPSGVRWNFGRECCPVIFRKWRLPRHLEIFYMPQIYDMGPTALLPLRRKACWGFFALKNPKASAGFEPAKFGAKGQHRSHCSKQVES